MKLKIKAFALSAGVLWGAFILLVTVLFVVCGYAGATLSKLYKIYPGYCVSWAGALIGMVWGFISAAIVGGLFAWLYNIFSGDSDSK